MRRRARTPFRLNSRLSPLKLLSGSWQPVSSTAIKRNAISFVADLGLTHSHHPIAGASNGILSILVDGHPFE